MAQPHATAWLRVEQQGTSVSQQEKRDTRVYFSKRNRRTGAVTKACSVASRVINGKKKKYKKKTKLSMLHGPAGQSSAAAFQLKVFDTTVPLERERG